MRILIVSVSTLHNLYNYYATCVHTQFLQVNIKVGVSYGIDNLCFWFLANGTPWH